MTSNFGRLRQKVGAGALAATLGFSAVAALVPATAGATATVTNTRFAGEDRYDTAAKAALSAFPNGSNNLIVASGENFPDGLAASYLSGAAAAPVLLTRADSLPTATSNALGALDSLAAGSATVHVMGGLTAISQTVRNQIKALGYTLVESYSGTDRYDTAAKVATAANAISGVSTFGGLKTAILATGRNFPDALAAGGLAQGGKFPILLVDTAAIPAATDAALTSLGIKNVILMGGTEAIGTAVETALTAKAIGFSRVAGTNRYDTAAKLATLETTSVLNGGFGWAGTSAVLASGLNFPDALAAAQVSGVNNAPIVLTASLPAESAAFLASRSATIAKLWVMGGLVAIDDATVTAATTSATTAAPTATITALDGASRATVVYSATVLNPTLTTNYAINNGAGGAGIASVTYDATTRTATVVLSAKLIPGDVFTVNPTGGTITSATAVAVAKTSTTVTADVTKPIATIKAFSNSPTAYVFFNEAVTTVSAQLLSTDGKSTGGLTSADSGAGLVWQGTWGSNPAVGQTANLAAGAFADVAAAHNTNLASSGVVVNDTTGPSVVSATTTTAPSVASIYTLTSGAGSVTITAKSTGAAFGSAGNGWTFVNGGTNPTVAVSVNATTKQISVGGPVQTAVDASAIVTALSNNATFAPLFSATVSNEGNVNLTTATLANPTPGASTVTVKVTFSEPLKAIAANPTINTSAGIAAPGEVTASPANAVTMLFGTASFSYPQPGAGLTNGTPISVSFNAGGLTDLAGQLSLASTTAVS